MVNPAFNLDKRKELALELRRRGGNCSCCVVAAFPDITAPIEPALISRMAEGLGGGVGGCGLTCGVITAMAMIDGLAREDGLSKAEAYGRVSRLVHEFEKNNGSTQCRELKTVLRRDCNSLIIDGVTILHNSLCAD